MKGFLIFLALAFPVVLASPFFWSLVRMEWGAERVGYVHEGPRGERVTQWASLGPKSGWPAWALVPAGVKLKVSSNFEAAPGFDAGGVGDIAGKVPPRATVERFQTALRGGGWDVRVGRLDATYPEIPPRPLHWCIVHARRGPRALQMAVDIDEAQTVGRLHWAEGKMRFPMGVNDAPCWR